MTFPPNVLSFFFSFVWNNLLSLYLSSSKVDHRECLCKRWVGRRSRIPRICIKAEGELVDERGEEEELPGKVVPNYAFFLFQKYQHYVTNYDSAYTNLLQLRGKNPSLDKFIQQFCKDTNQLELSAYFILPIQRLPRYEVHPLPNR